MRIKTKPLLFLIVFLLGLKTYCQQNTYNTDCFVGSESNLYEHYKDSIKATTSAIEKDPSNAKLYGKRGFYRTAIGEDSASYDYFKSLQLDANYVNAYFSYGLFFF